MFSARIFQFFCHISDPQVRAYNPATTRLAEYFCFSDLSHVRARVCEPYL